MTVINAFHPDYVKTYMPELTQKIIKEQKAKENGQLYGSKAREKESSSEPNANTINRFPKKEKL
jgi:hypothetical protein